MLAPRKREENEPFFDGYTQGALLHMLGVRSSGLLRSRNSNGIKLSIYQFPQILSTPAEVSSHPDLGAASSTVPGFSTAAAGIVDGPRRFWTMRYPRSAKSRGFELSQGAYHKISQQHDNCYFANCWHVYRRLLLDIRIEILHSVNRSKTRSKLPWPTFSLEKLIHTAPSLSKCVGNLKFSPGTPLITTSLRGTQSSKPQPSFSITSCLLFLIPAPLVNCCTPVTSTEYTQAPSFANNAANGLPTTSDRLTTVMECPNNLFPYGKIVL